MVMDQAQDGVWVEKWRYDDAETQYYEKLSGATVDDEMVYVEIDNSSPESDTTLAEDLTNKQITTTTSCVEGKAVEQGTGSAAAAAATPSDLINRVTKLEGEKTSLTKTIQSLEKAVAELTKRLDSLECSGKGQSGAPAEASAPVDDEDDDEEVDLFGSDDEEEDADALRIRDERLKQYAEKKSKKVGPIAKSSVLLDCKPWDDETDLKVMESHIREIKMDGLNWGAAKSVPLAFGIHKLSILCIVEDEKVSVDDLIEIIEELEDFVQSVDVAAFNKI